MIWRKGLLCSVLMAACLSGAARGQNQAPPELEISVNVQIDQLVSTADVVTVSCIVRSSMHAGTPIVGSGAFAFHHRDVSLSPWAHLFDRTVFPKTILRTEIFEGNGLKKWVKVPIYPLDLVEQAEQRPLESWTAGECALQVTSGVPGNPFATRPLTLPGARNTHPQLCDTSAQGFERCIWPGSEVRHLISFDRAGLPQQD